MATHQQVVAMQSLKQHCQLSDNTRFGQKHQHYCTVLYSPTAPHSPLALRLARQQPQHTRQDGDLYSLKVPLWLPITLPRQRCARLCCLDLQPAAFSQHVHALDIQVLTCTQQVACKRSCKRSKWYLSTKETAEGCQERCGEAHKQDHQDTQPGNHPSTADTPLREPCTPRLTQQDVPLPY